MAKKITGYFTGGIPYEALIPDDVYPDYVIDNVTCNGNHLNIATISIVEVDEYNYVPVKKAALREALYESNDLTSVEAAINAANGVVKIWWEDMQYITLENPKTLMIQTALGWSETKVKGIFRRANEIQIANQ